MAIQKNALIPISGTCEYATFYSRKDFEGPTKLRNLWQGVSWIIQVGTI